jgi:cation diffusion facilitator CzcD-associated flavoprotein CzcO
VRGYYSYEEGHRPQWEGEADFAGAIVPPQFWPETSIGTASASP